MQEIIVYDAEDNILDTLVQWDKEVKIFVKEDSIDKAYNVHYFNCNSKTAMVVPSSYDSGILSAPVPNDILTESHPITGYIYIEKDGEHKSVYCFRIIVRKRPKPADYIYSDEKEYITFEAVLEAAKKYASSASDSATASQNSAKAAKISEINAKESEVNSKESEESSKISEERAKESEIASKTSEEASNTSEINSKESENNAKRSEFIAIQKASEATDSVNKANISEANSKASEEASKKSEQVAKQSEENALASANTATQKANEASNSADSAEEYYLKSKSYAVGTDGTIRPSDATDNSKFYSDLAQQLTDKAQELLEQAQKIVSAATSGSLVPMGTVAFADLPTEAKIGHMYNIADDFTTDERFAEGSGVFYRAGANVYWTADGKWDVMVGAQVTGIKGEAEDTYHNGNVNITRRAMGLDNIPNVTTNDQTPTFTQADERKNIESGDKLSTIMGKIKRFFADLKAVAFTGSYTDLSNKPTKEDLGLGNVANERQYSASNPQPSVTGSSGSCTGTADNANYLNVINGNELRLAGNIENISQLWINWKPKGGVDSPTKLTQYNFGNGQGSVSGVLLSADYFSGSASKVNNHTVNADVPSNAKFTDTTYSNATQSASGLLSAADKIKLDGIATGANKTTIANNLTTKTTGSALDAYQGYKLDEKIYILDGKITQLNSNLFFKSGDTISLNLLIVNGFLTTSKTEIDVNIPVGKRLDNITSAKTSNAIGTVRQGGAYIIGSATSGHGFAADQGVFEINKDTGMLKYKYTFSSALSAGTNNDTISLQFMGGTIVLS